MSEASVDQLVAFFKVLSNENRLRIAGLIAEKERTVGELAELLSLREPTVSEHLAQMREINLVQVRPDANKRYYRLNPKALHSMSKSVLSREGLADLVKPRSDDDESRVLRTFIVAGRLRTIPRGRKQLLIVLNYVAELFAFDRRYTEKEVNKQLKALHEDFATLRRELVDFHFMERDKGVYWRVERQVEPAP